MSWNFEPDHPDQDTFDDFAEDDEADADQAEEAEASEITDASPDQEDLAEDETERTWDEVECGMMDGSEDPIKLECEKMSKPYLVTKEDMREIIVHLSRDGEVTEDQIEELIDAWNEFREPDVSVSDILWALKRADAFHHRKIGKLWCSFGDS